MNANYRRTRRKLSLRHAAREREPVLQEMERQAKERDIPIVGPAVGRLFYQYARLLNAKTVFEMGSAIGYSTIWWAKAVGDGGKVHYTDGSRKNADEARRYFQQAGVSRTASRSTLATRWNSSPSAKSSSTFSSTTWTSMTIRASSTWPRRACAKADSSLPTTPCGPARWLTRPAIPARAKDPDRLTADRGRRRAEPPALLFARLVHHHRSAA